MAVYQLGDLAPRIAESAYVAEQATVIGNVAIGERSSVWPGAVIRGDNETIRIGERVNIQAGAVLHADPGCPLTIGDAVSVGHQAMVHGCTIGEGSPPRAPNPCTSSPSELPVATPESLPSLMEAQ